jgi:hypothetical protein
MYWAFSFEGHPHGDAKWLDATKAICAVYAAKKSNTLPTANFIFGM